MSFGYKTGSPKKERLKFFVGLEKWKTSDFFMFNNESELFKYKGDYIIATEENII